MKVKITFELGDEERAAIAFWGGHAGKASYRTVKRFIAVQAQEGLDEAMSVYNKYWNGESITTTDTGQKS